MGDVAGAYQVVSDRRERERADIEWEARYRDLAGHLVSRISEHEAEEEGPGYNARGEDVRVSGHEVQEKHQKEKATRSNEETDIAAICLMGIRMASESHVDCGHFLIPTTTRFRGLCL